jgi:DNA-binding response OmpR family regulator
LAKLLVSDDEPQVLELVSLVLEGAGHSVVTTSDPRSVYALAAGGDFDGIILDVNMPVSGFELLNRLRSDEITASLPILFLSGLAEPPDRARGLREGADDYLVKPFEPAELVLRVERLLAWRERTGRVATGVNTGGDRVGDGADREVAKNGGDSGTPQRFGRYEVLDIIGQGSMGTVYRGRDPRLERPVALKTIRLETAADNKLEMLHRLRREAVTIARINQPNIIAVYDMGNAEDTAFIAMELVEGVSLRDHLKIEGPLSPERMIPMAAAVARGLAAAHSRQVIHRDVKPGNVLCSREGAIKVSDFGLAFVVSSMTEDSTEISGTPGYVPPEVMNKHPYTEPGDLFGLGATLYESLTGIHPLAGATLRDTIMNTLNGDYRPLTDYVSDLPSELVEIVEQLLDVDPSQRPSAERVADFLERYAAERGLRWDPRILPDAGRVQAAFSERRR